MNSHRTYKMNTSRIKALVLGFLLILGAAGNLLAAAGTITATASPNSNIIPGNNILVTLRISGYTDPIEVDGFNLTVSYPAALFSFVGGSFDPGAGAGPDQQWLSKATQEAPGAGYFLADLNDGTTTPGFVTITMLDLGFSAPEAGTVANDGFLVSFKLLANAVGAGVIVPAAFPGPSVLFDAPALAPVGVPAMAFAHVAVGGPVQPPMTIARLGANVVISWPAPSTGFVLESTASLSPISWSPAGAPVVVVGPNNTATLAATGTRYFRLRCP